jgi:hypothetical protein
MSNLISSFRKMIKENLVVEIIGKQFKKIVENLGMQELELE